MNYYMLRIVVFFIFITYCFGQILSQTQAPHRTCGHNQIEDFTQDENGKIVRSKLKQKLNFQLANNYQHRQLEDSIVLPVAIHFQEFATIDTSCMISQAIDAINRLNDDFHAANADIGNWDEDQPLFPDVNVGASKIKFCLGEYNHPAGYDLDNGDLAITFNQTSGDRVLDWQGYLNIFVRDISDFAGFAPAGGFGFGDGVTIDDNYFGTFSCNGIPIRANFKLNRTVTHEVGHYLYLEHTWGPDPVGTDQTITCAVDDNVADTPLSGSAYFGCPGVGSQSCGTLDLNMNFMQYVNDPCMYMFTQGQVERMEAYANLILPSLTTNKFFVCDGMSYCQNLNNGNDIDCVPTNGTFRIENISSENSLMVVGGQMDNFAKIVQWDWTGCDYQQWYLEAQPNGYYKIFAKHSNKVIDAIFPENNPNNNHEGIAFQYSDDDYLTQFWSIVPVPGENCTFQIKSAVDDSYGLGIIFQAIFKGWNLQLQKLDSNNPSQQFKFYNLDGIGTPPISLDIKAGLQGPYDDSSGVMHADLRAQNLIPITNPYANDSKFEHLVDESTAPSVFSVTGNNAIIDWILIEIRKEDDPSVIIESRAALLQSDGDIVDIDGTSSVGFITLAGNYYVALRHRNHLGIMTKNPIPLGKDTPINFTNPQFELYGENAAQITNSNVRVMWAGNVNSNENIIFQGTNNDTNSIFFDVLTAPANSQGATNYIYSGYYKSDVNMDGKVIYQGEKNDPNIIFFNTLSHPNNNFGSTNFIILERMP